MLNLPLNLIVLISVDVFLVNSVLIVKLLGLLEFIPATTYNLHVILKRLVAVAILFEVFVMFKCRIFKIGPAELKQFFNVKHSVYNHIPLIDMVCIRPLLYTVVYLIDSYNFHIT